MIEVIKNNAKMKGVCRYCESVFSYNVRDLKVKKAKERWIDGDCLYVQTWTFANVLKCPCCKKWIDRSEENLNDFVFVLELNK